MNEKTIAALVKPDHGSGTMFFGIHPDDPAIQALNLPIGVALRGDCRHLSAADLAGSGGGADGARPPIHRAVCRLFAEPNAPQQDAIAVIEVLIGLGFTGEILVLAPPLLRPKMVESELRGLARGKTLRLIAGVLPPLSEV